MAKAIIGYKEYSLYNFDSETEFEQAVIENQKQLFGNDSVYIDIKRKIGRDNHRGIPDAFLIDFYDIKSPQLYIVENELASHDVYSHISEQIARFGTSAVTSANQIRNILIKAVEDDDSIKKELENFLPQTIFKTTTELMLHLTENEIKIAIVIDETTADLNHALKIFKNPPDVVTLQRYQSGDSLAYFYEPMREEIDNIKEKKTEKGETIEFDTVVCAAFEEGFKRAYIGNSAWWEIRLSQKAREQLKYLAIYEKSPIAHIKHFAEIDRIEPYKDTGKYILYLKNKKTIKPIKLDDNAKKGDAPQAPRYTTLDRLLKAKKVTDLWYWR